MTDTTTANCCAAQEIRDAAANLARAIVTNCPDSADRDAAVRDVRLAAGYGIQALGDDPLDGIDSAA